MGPWLHRAALATASCWVLAQASSALAQVAPAPTIPSTTTAPTAPAPTTPPTPTEPVATDPIGGDPVSGDELAPDSPVGGATIRGTSADGPEGRGTVPPLDPAPEVGRTRLSNDPISAPPVDVRPFDVEVLGEGGAVDAGSAVPPRTPMADGPVATYPEARGWTLTEHPLAIAARAVERRGTAELLSARGAYDPNLQADFERKQYIKSTYFEYVDAGVEWQSPYAFKLEGGRQWAEGININPERTLPTDGQAYLAIKLPLLQGLLTDKYRVGVRRGEVSVDLNRAAADIIRNELRYDLAVRYAEWAYADLVERITRQTEDLIRTRLDATRELYVQGDKPAVDTLEALISLANQQLASQAANVSVLVARQNLRAIYWTLPEGARPDYAVLDPDLPLDTAVVARHPELRTLRADFADLELQRRLYREYLKPRLDVSYSVLGDGFDLTPADGGETQGQLLTSAYKIGATFRYPLFNRRARGQLQSVDIKQAETGAKLESKRQELNLKAEANVQAAIALERQLSQLDKLVDQTERLLQAERELFSLGESTQFLLNSREQSYQKALTTRAKAQLSYAKAIYAYRQATASWGAD